MSGDQELSAGRYLDAVLDVAARAGATQQEVIVAAARAVADTVAAGGRWWVFGTGHSHLLVEELWGRAGGMVDVHPILEPSLMLHEGLRKSSLLERLPGLASVLLELHPMTAGDCLLVISNSGRNAVPVELAEQAARRDVTVIALTSLAHTESVTSRAPSGRVLADVADLVIDNCGVPGDAILPYRQGTVGATSTVVGAMLLQALSVEVIAELERRGRPAHTLTSLNA